MSFGLAVENWSSSVGTTHTAGDGQIVLSALNGLPTLPAARIYRLTALTNSGTPAETILGVFQATGRAALALTGVTAAPGYADVNLAAGVALEIRVCKATIDELQASLDTITTAIPAGTASNASLKSLVLTNGDYTTTVSTVQMGFGFQGTPQYAHWLETQHFGGSPAGNRLKFYTSDGTASGVFPTNGVLGLSIENGVCTATTLAATATLTHGVQVGNIGLQYAGTNNCFIADNIYYDGAWKYKANGYGGRVYFNNGAVQLDVFPQNSLGAGAAATATTPILIDNTANVSITASIIIINSWQYAFSGGFKASNNQQVMWCTGAAFTAADLGLARLAAGVLGCTNGSSGGGAFATGTSTTAARPTGMVAGAQWYDTTIGKPIWWNGSVWKDAMGNTV